MAEDATATVSRLRKEKIQMKRILTKSKNKILTALETVDIDEKEIKDLLIFYNNCDKLVECLVTLSDS